MFGEEEINQNFQTKITETHEAVAGFTLLPAVMIFPTARFAGLSGI